jgi:gas vesicle protein
MRGRDTQVRSRRRGAGGGEFVVGLLLGSALGAALAILWAPSEGGALRQDLSERLGDLGRAARDRWANAGATISSAVTKGREAYEEARNAVPQNPPDGSHNG